MARYRAGGSKEDLALMWGFKSVVVLGTFVLLLVSIVTFGAAVTGWALLSGRQIVAIVSVSACGVLAFFAIVYRRSLEAKFGKLVRVKTGGDNQVKPPD